MARKVLFIVFLITLLAGFFYYKPLFSKTPPEPSLVDRLPDGDFLGRIYILDVARESSPMLFYNKVPIRDFLTHEFLLAQGKNYGLDLQKPAYFFANESGEWGALISVNDSSKIYPGIVRLKSNIKLEDTLVSEQKVHVLRSEHLYLTYDKKWFFVYQGTQLPKRLYNVKFAEKNDVTKAWKAFTEEKQFKDEKLVIFSNSKKLRSQGIETALFAHDSDSMSVHIKTYIRNKKPLNISFKPSGLAFEDKLGTDKLVNLHLNVENLRNDKNDPIYKALVRLGKKVSFPTDAFLKAWNGDLSFHQGGTVKIKETFVESILDENFNVTEVKSSVMKDVPGFAFMMSTNEYQKEFLSKLFAKGIMRKENNKFYVLTSPPLRIRQTPSHIYLYSSDFTPKTKESNFNGGIWNDKGIKYGFSLDSLTSNELFGSVHIPVKRFLKRNKFF